MSNRKQILRELLPLLLPVSSGVHNIIIDDYLDIQAAIRAKYLEIIKAVFKRKLDAQPHHHMLQHINCSPNCGRWRTALDEPEKFNDAFVVFDEEPGYIDRAIWIMYENWLEPTEGLFFVERKDGVISGSTLQQAVLACFPDAQFDGFKPDEYFAHECSRALSKRADDCRSLQVYFHSARFTKAKETDFRTTEMTIYKKNGTKPALFKPPLTRLGRLQFRYNKWAEQPNDIHQQETQYVVFWTAFLSLLVFHVSLFSPVDPWSQRVGAIGTLCCWMLLTPILLYETAKVWRWAGKCARLMWVVTCIAMVSYAIKLTLILRDLEANPHVIMEFNWILQLKSLFN